ncbi:MAG: MurR/RpiR family transcriptional regulator [Streptococcaceae bacterium]|jgi:DNA-binding MurR/RpiR family transcriptional regulator|nr:MurR/RpiR family transcriptional regulator [Streptococcaceae bacterium]
MKFNERVQNQYFRLTEIEDDLVDYIQKNKAEVAKMKIVHLAEQFYTVPNTVTRFVRKLGYDGFSELKMELKNESDYPHLMGDSYQQKINRNFELIDIAREDKVVQCLRKAKNVNFYGLGQTGLVAKICADNFYALEDKFKFIDYPNEIRHQIENGKNQLFFFISLSGETKSVLELAELAKAVGHKVIGLTNLSDNSLSRLADVALYCCTEKEVVNKYDVTDKTPILIIMQSLFKSYLAEFHQNKK